MARPCLAQSHARHPLPPASLNTLPFLGPSLPSQICRQNFLCLECSPLLSTPPPAWLIHNLSFRSLIKNQNNNCHLSHARNRAKMSPRRYGLNPSKRPVSWCLPSGRQQLRDRPAGGCMARGRSWVAWGSGSPGCALLLKAFPPSPCWPHRPSELAQVEFPLCG